MITSVTRKAYLPADLVTHAPEEEGAERPHDESHRERGQVRDERKRVVAGRIEERGDDRRQAAEDVEVVPLDHRADGGRGDDVPNPVVFDEIGAAGASGRGGQSAHDALANPAT
jgi:hypothetical protein